MTYEEAQAKAKAANAALLGLMGRVIVVKNARRAGGYQTRNYDKSLTYYQRYNDSVKGMQRRIQHRRAASAAHLAELIAALPRNR